MGLQLLKRLQGSRWLIIMAVCGACAGGSSGGALELWYDRPAVEWNEALPIGNGRLGAMVFGGTAHERIQFNEETLWTGEPREYNRPGAATVVGQLRQLLAEGRQAEAERLAGERFMGLRSPAGDRNAWRSKVLAAGTPDNDDFWQVMELPTHGGWEVAGIPGLEGLDGAVWFRTAFDVPDSLLEQPLVLDLGKIRDEDFTYLNGRLIGNTDGAGKDRRYLVPAGSLKASNNQLTVLVLNYYDKGGFVGYKDTTVPLALYPAGKSHEAGLPLPERWHYFVQNDDAPAEPRYQADYQPFADLLLQLPGHDSVASYRRMLDIANAVATTSYMVNGVTFTREYFASYPANVLVAHIRADQRGAVSVRASLRSPHKNSRMRRVDGRTLGLTLQVKRGALRGESLLRVVPRGGDVSVTDTSITVAGADEVTLYLAAATNFKRYDDTSGRPDEAVNHTLAALEGQPYHRVKQDHIADYRSFFDTFSIGFGGDTLNHLPTDQRIARFADGKDPQLLALYAQYGRYLLISSSRPGTQPANLQGLWNGLMTPPWGSKYTTNINLEMNYWPAEVMGLSALHEPLFDMVDELRERGRETARIHYGTPGWVVHHNTDLWRGTAPINHPNHGIWLGAPAWLCHHLWEHYLFTLDEDFLRDRAYPVMKEAALFYQHNLQEDTETGYLISSPSNSPEHGGLVAGPAMDHQLIRALFGYVVAASARLGIDEDWAADIRALAARIAPDRIGRFGQLQEWLDDVDDPENKHRHMSHLWAVHPGAGINGANDPALMEAARISLNHRGDEGTGWSLAWKINLWARLLDASRTEKLLKMLISPAARGGGSYPNLLDAHPPFQIDGNFGGAAGIVEALLQSHTEGIDVLPALLPMLPFGQVSGIRARGGFVIDLKWEKHRLTELRVLSIKGGPLRIRYSAYLAELATEPGSSYRFDSKLQRL
ncbi:glycoside hydrolase family 95 protein [Parapedobacter composti]|nr:glycoside hydrolase family 95 protein [Parapedobacter composti]